MSISPTINCDLRKEFTPRGGGLEKRVVRDVNGAYQNCLIPVVPSLTDTDQRSITVKLHGVLTTSDFAGWVR